MSKAMKEFRGMSAEDIQKKVDELQGELVKFRTQIGAGTAPQLSGMIQKTKKDIARLKTALREQELQTMAEKVAKGEEQKA